MNSCPSCLAELRVDPERAAEGMIRVLAAGGRLPRPAGVAPFARGLSCSLLRTGARSALIYCGADELMEASVEGVDHRAIVPLSCVDFDGSVLFRLRSYEAAEDAVVAFSADGAPLATYLRVRIPGPGVDALAMGLNVRDETSAPAAVLRPSRRGSVSFELAETGGEVVATCSTIDMEDDGWVDDQWSLSVLGDVPLRPMATVALLLAAKVLLGRPSPSSSRATYPGDDTAAEEWPYRL